MSVTTQIDPGNSVVVETKSAWLSKINWTQAVAVSASILTFATGGKVGIPLEQQVAIVTLITTAQGLATWVIKTWFTPTVSPASITPATQPTQKVAAASALPGVSEIVVNTPALAAAAKAVDPTTTVTVKS